MSKWHVDRRRHHQFDQKPIQSNSPVNLLLPFLSSSISICTPRQVLPWILSGVKYQYKRGYQSQWQVVGRDLDPKASVLSGRQRHASRRRPPPLCSIQCCQTHGKLCLQSTGQSNITVSEQRRRQPVQPPFNLGAALRVWARWGPLTIPGPRSISSLTPCRSSARTRICSTEINVNEC